jgi:hypothetical protein
MVFSHGKSFNALDEIITQRWFAGFRTEGAVSFNGVFPGCISTLTLKSFGYGGYKEL